MLTTSERMTKLNIRINKYKAMQQIRRKIAFSFAACFLLIIAVSSAIPCLLGQFAKQDYSNTGFAASMFAGSEILGLIIVGMFAFALGVCVTILCYKLRRLNCQEREGAHGRDN